MDKDRQIRMLIPPFFLLASVVWEAYLSGELWQYLHTTTATADVASLKTVLSVLAVVGVATLPVGYGISMLTLWLLQVISPLFPQKAYDVPISKRAMARIWQRLGLSEGPPKSTLSAAAVFDHAFLQLSIHQWLFRRWTTFNICTQCAMALFLSYFLGHALHIQPTRKWLLTIAFSIGIFISQAITSWKETYQMFDFVVDIDAVIRKPEANPTSAGADASSAHRT